MKNDFFLVSRAAHARCYEVEFDDMEHTIEWLLETAEKHRFHDMKEYLMQIRRIVIQKRRSILL